MLVEEFKFKSYEGESRGLGSRFQSYKGESRGTKGDFKLLKIDGGSARRLIFMWKKIMWVKETCV